jgi:chorismate synthase
MASNSFGKIFRITTWGESHGRAVGVVIDGCPAGLEINEGDIDKALAFRSPGQNPYTSSRVEPDKAEILSGVFENRTTGSPICIMIPNRDADSSKYESTKHLLRPGHANYTYLEKYGVFDYRGGGRASGRETACRVAAGAIAKKILLLSNIQIVAYVGQIGSIKARVSDSDAEVLRSRAHASLVYCPDDQASSSMQDLIQEARKVGDSLGGLVEFLVTSLPTGFGDPIYQKLEANLSAAMMSLPASKGFEIGSGFGSVCMSGTEHNDPYEAVSGKVRTATNYAGGTLGGISNGMPLVGKVAFKPASGIMTPQSTLNVEGGDAVFRLPLGSRHDPCIAIRAVPVVEAMAALVIVDAMLANRSARL